MNISSKKTDDLEQERQDLVGEIVAEHGPAWTEQYRPGSYGCHELLDRSLLTAEFVEQTVLNHPACVQNPEWFELASTAVTALNELYQRIGADHLQGSNQDGEAPP
jgi:hypothetical protein